MQNIWTQNVKKGQFVNTVKSQEWIQSSINYTINIAAKIVEVLNQSNEISDTNKNAYDTEKQEREYLKKKWKAK
jgi:hypothetical protein